MGPVRLPILKQLPRALQLEPDVVYFWGGQIPPDIRPSGLREATVQKAWAAFRTVIARARARPGKTSGPTRSRLRAKRSDEPILRGWKGRRTLGGLIAWRRRQLGLTRIALAERIKGERASRSQRSESATLNGIVSGCRGGRCCGAWRGR